MQEIRWNIEEERQEPADFVNTNTTRYQGIGTLYHAGGTFSETYGVPEISNLWAHWNFKWKDNLLTEVCAKSAFPHITMHWMAREMWSAKYDQKKRQRPRRQLQGRCPLGHPPVLPLCC